MTIDTSMYGNIKPVQIENPLNAYAKVAAVQQAQNQNRLADLVFSEKQRAVDQENALSSLYKNAVGADGSIDRTKLLTGAAQGGLGAKIPALQKGLADMDKSAADAQKVKLENGLKQFEVVGQIMSGVKDQASYDAAKQQIAQIIGPEAAAHQPAVYDPAIIEQGRLKAMSVKDQMTQQLNQLKFGEDQRHNKVQEGISYGNLGVAQANLGVSRARLAMEQNAPKGQYDSERGVLIDPRTGTARPVIGANGQPLGEKDKPLTEGQSKAALFGARMQAANNIFDGLAANGTTTAIPGMHAYGIGGIITGLSSSNQQSLDQAQRDFVNATLRRESGAAIAPSEFDNAIKQYFPQPGDSAAVVAQKKANRERAARGILAEVPANKRDSIVNDINGPSSGLPPDIAALLKKHGGK